MHLLKCGWWKKTKGALEKVGGLASGRALWDRPEPKIAKGAMMYPDCGHKSGKYGKLLADQKMVVSENYQ